MRKGRKDRLIYLDKSRNKTEWRSGFILTAFILRFSS
nr:MAG TPA: hypothetical protein [Caudoviricetes sp.]